MEKQTKILLGLAAAGVVAYLVYNKNKPKYASFSDPQKELFKRSPFRMSADGLTAQKLSNQIDAVHATIPVDLNAITPNYGKPIDVLFKNHSGQMNFVDVLHNDYFKPKNGTFRPIEGYSNPNISGVPINII